MSMTREKALESYERLYDYMVGDDDAVRPDYVEFVELSHYIRAALSGPTREMVERMREEWKHYLPPLGAGNVQCRCTKCGRTPDEETPFCAWCGSPMADEAVDMMLEKWKEAMDGEKNE